MADAVSRPGIDPRAWIMSARVDDDPDAISFIEGTGWVVDVTITSGPLSGEGPITCRVASAFALNAAARLEPVTKSAEVMVAFIDGDPNTAPIIFGYAFNPADLAVPETVNGETIDEAFALENHILVTPHSVQEQVGGTHTTKVDGDVTYTSEENVTVEAGSKVTIEAGTDIEGNADNNIDLTATNVFTAQGGPKAQLLGALINLASDTATEPYVKGATFATSLSAFLTLASASFAADALTWTALATTVGVLFPPLVPFFQTSAAAATAASTGCGTLAGQMVPGVALSVRIKGE